LGKSDSTLVALGGCWSFASKAAKGSSNSSSTSTTNGADNLADKWNALMGQNVSGGRVLQVRSGTAVRQIQPFVHVCAPVRAQSLTPAETTFRANSFHNLSGQHVKPKLLVSPERLGDGLQVIALQSTKAQEVFVATPMRPVAASGDKTIA
jgi:hypothetical protein